jgi:L-lactate dehydrogenase complex protein LldF
MGAVLSPAFFGQNMLELSHASSFCGRCVEVCPVQIPLTKLMRKWRGKSRQKFSGYVMMKLWAFLAARPALYNFSLKRALPIGAKLARSKKWAHHLPGLAAWARHRSPPPVAEMSFQTQWTEYNRTRKRDAS